MSLWIIIFYVAARHCRILLLACAMEDDYRIDRIQNVIKQLVHASAVQMSRYEALGKLGEHSSG